MNSDNSKISDSSKIQDSQIPDFSHDSNNTKSTVHMSNDRDLTVHQNNEENIVNLQYATFKFSFKMQELMEEQITQFRKDVLDGIKIEFEFPKGDTFGLYAYLAMDLTINQVKESALEMLTENQLKAFKQIRFFVNEGEQFKFSPLDNNSKLSICKYQNQFRVFYAVIEECIQQPFLYKKIILKIKLIIQQTIEIIENQIKNSNHEDKKRLLENDKLDLKFLQSCFFSLLLERITGNIFNKNITNIFYQIIHSKSKNVNSYMNSIKLILSMYYQEPKKANLIDMEFFADILDVQVMIYQKVKLSQNIFEEKLVSNIRDNNLKNKEMQIHIVIHEEEVKDQRLINAYILYKEQQEKQFDQADLHCSQCTNIEKKPAQNYPFFFQSQKIFFCFNCLMKLKPKSEVKSNIS